MRECDMGDVHAFLEKYVNKSHCLTSIWLNKEDEKNQSIGKSIEDMKK